MKSPFRNLGVWNRISPRKVWLDVNYRRTLISVKSLNHQDTIIYLLQFYDTQANWVWAGRTSACEDSGLQIHSMPSWKDPQGPPVCFIVATMQPVKNEKVRKTIYASEPGTEFRENSHFGLLLASIFDNANILQFAFFSHSEHQPLIL
jgi:hypothetical protein